LIYKNKNLLSLPLNCQNFRIFQRLGLSYLSNDSIIVSCGRNLAKRTEMRLDTFFQEQPKDINQFWSKTGEKMALFFYKIKLWSWVWIIENRKLKDLSIYSKDAWVVLAFSELIYKSGTWPTVSSIRYSWSFLQRPGL
jgi:hypothetical protein